MIPFFTPPSQPSSPFYYLLCGDNFTPASRAKICSTRLNSTLRSILNGLPGTITMWMQFSFSLLREELRAHSNEDSNRSVPGIWERERSVIFSLFFLRAVLSHWMGVCFGWEAESTQEWKRTLYTCWGKLVESVIKGAKRGKIFLTQIQLSDSERDH